MWESPRNGHTVQINRLKQDNISRNLLIKEVPELEKDNDQLKSMVRTIFHKLRYDISLTYEDCYRIGRMKDNTCRPIVVVLPNVGLNNLIIRDKRPIRLSCANFSHEGVAWGPADDLLYIDEHLTHENYLLYMAARKLKQYGTYGQGTVIYLLDLMMEVRLCRLSLLSRLVDCQLRQRRPNPMKALWKRMINLPKGT